MVRNEREKLIEDNSKTYPGAASGNVSGDLLAIADRGRASTGLVDKRGVAAIVDRVSLFEVLHSHILRVQAGRSAAGHGEQRCHEERSGEVHFALSNLEAKD